MPYYIIILYSYIIETHRTTVCITNHGKLIYYKGELIFLTITIAIYISNMVIAAA